MLKVEVKITKTPRKGYLYFWVVVDQKECCYLIWQRNPPPPSAGKIWLWASVLAMYALVYTISAKEGPLSPPPSLNKNALWTSNRNGCAFKLYKKGCCCAATLLDSRVSIHVNTVSSEPYLSPICRNHWNFSSLYIGQLRNFFANSEPKLSFHF